MTTDTDIMRSVVNAQIEAARISTNDELRTLEDPWGNERVAFAARGSIDPKDFGLQWNQMLEAGGVLVGDKIEISLDIEGVRAAAQAAA
jgi:hypothetical protein